MKLIREFAASHPIWNMALLIATAVMCSAFLLAEPAQAGLIDRLQDIYKAPDKLEEIQSEYNQAKEELNRQTEQFAAEREEMQQQTEALMGRNEALAAQNESLASQNAALLERLDQAEREKEKKAALTRKIVLTSVTILGLGMAYFLSIRMWRFTAWRRHQRLTGGQSR
jgi:Uncharacterized conserved protein